MRLKPQGANQTVIELADGTVILFSYETPVAAFVPGRGYFRTDHFWSRTTSKHITQWLGREGIASAQEAPQAFFNTLAQGRAQ